jgi:hypothetical protein
MVPGRFHALTSVNQTEWMTHAGANTGHQKLGEQDPIHFKEDDV